MDKFSEILNVKEYLHTPVRKLSLGERMRCDLAASLLHSPPLLYLDEPTIGLDVVAKDHIREFLKEVNRTERTTVSTTLLVDASFPYPHTASTSSREYGISSSITSLAVSVPVLSLRTHSGVCTRRMSSSLANSG